MQDNGDTNKYQPPVNEETTPLQQNPPVAYGQPPAYMAPPQMNPPVNYGQPPVNMAPPQPVYYGQPPAAGYQPLPNQ